MPLYIQNLYQKTQIKKYQWDLIFADKNHPIFKAHFEHFPLLPAFLQIDIAAELAALEIIGIKQAKFLNPIKPQDEVQYILIEKDSSNWILKINHQAKLTSQVWFQAIKG